MLFDLALRLHKSVEEIRRLPCSELTGWLAYFSLQQQTPDIHEITPEQEYAQFRKVLG